MNIKPILFAGAAIGFLASPVLAVSQDTLDRIIAEYSGQNFTKVEIKNMPNSVKVEAYGPDGKVERVYDADGNLVRERTRSGGLGSGSDDSGYDDDRDDDKDDDKDDDRDDDRDDDKDDDKDDDRDHDRNDDKDDDKNDDKDDD